MQWLWTRFRRSHHQGKKILSSEREEVKQCQIKFDIVASIETWDLYCIRIHLTVILFYHQIDNVIVMFRGFCSKNKNIVITLRWSYSYHNYKGMLKIYLGKQETLSQNLMFSHLVKFWEIKDLGRLRHFQHNLIEKNKKSCPVNSFFSDLGSKLSVAACIIIFVHCMITQFFYEDRGSECSICGLWLGRYLLLCYISLGRGQSWLSIILYPL